MGCLSFKQIEILRRAMFAAADGSFFPDWEFETLMGGSREEVRRVAREWQQEEGESKRRDIAVNVLNNFLGYPHRKDVESAVGSSVIELHEMLFLLET